MVVLWLYCQVSKSPTTTCPVAPGAETGLTWPAPAERLLKHSPNGRRNGVKLEYLISLTKTYIEFLCKKEHISSPTLLARRIDSTFQNVKKLVFQNVTLFSPCSPELTAEYYFELLQQLTGVSPERHMMIYNTSHLDSCEAQIVRLRGEVEDRQAAMLQQVRRSSAHYCTEEEAAVALKEQQESLRRFKEHVDKYNTGLHGSPLAPRKIDRTRAISMNFEPNNHNFTVTFSIWQVEAANGALETDTSHFCSAKCSGSQTVKRTKYQIVDKEGRMHFENIFSFETPQPSPKLKIKLKEVKDGLFARKKVIAEKKIKIPIHYGKNSTNWRKETMSAPEEGAPVISIEYKHEVKYSSSIKMLGRMTAWGLNGHWREEKKRFFILYKGSTDGEEDGLQEIGENGDLLQNLSPLTEYHVLRWITVPERAEGKEHAFQLLREGEEVYFNAESEEEKTVWVRQLFLLTKQTHQTDGVCQMSPLFAPSPDPRSPNRTIFETLTNVPGQAQGPDTLAVISRETSPLRDRRWPASDISAREGDHTKYFLQINKKMLDLNLESCRPVSDGKLHEAHHALLLEYKDRYDISDGLYHVTMLKDLVNKMEEGYFVDPGIINPQILEALSVSTLREEQHATKQMALENLFDYIKNELMGSIFQKFPYNLADNQLFGHSLLLKRLAEDLCREKEMGDLMLVMMDSFNRSILVEYEVAIAPRELAEFDLEGCKYREMHQAEQMRVFDSLMTITSNCLLFLENFIVFFAEHLLHHYKDIDIKSLCESVMRLYNHDLAKLVAYLPTCEGVFELYHILNSFCAHTPYLQFGQFHRNDLHEAFLVHVLAKIERHGNQIVEKTNALFEEESWDKQGWFCASVESLTKQIGAFQHEIDALRWPNPDFRNMFTEMTEEKCSHIRLKYCNQISQMISESLKRDKGITTLTLRMVNSMLGLYSSVPAVLDITNDLDKIVLVTLADVATPFLRYLDRILGDWDSPLFTALVGTRVSGVRNKAKRARELMLYLASKSEETSRCLHPDFSDTYLYETYRTLLRHLHRWFEERSSGRHCYPAQVYAIREVVERLEDAFHVRAVLRLKTAKVPEYLAIDSLLRAEEVQILDGAKDNSKLLDEIKKILSSLSEN